MVGGSPGRAGAATPRAAGGAATPRAASGALLLGGVAGIAVTLVTTPLIQDSQAPTKQVLSAALQNSSRASAKAVWTDSAGHYTTSQVSPCRPPREVTEFPPQSAQPSLSRGNFLVGEGRPPDSATPLGAARGRALVPAPITHSLYESPRSFPGSLRRYPSPSPPPSPPADSASTHLQQLLTLTQHKHSSTASSRAAPNVRALRPVRHRATRDPPTRDRARNEPRPRNTATVSVPMCGAESAQSPPRRAHTLVTAPCELCPEMRRRYRAHRREHHSDRACPEEGADAQEGPASRGRSSLHSAPQLDTQTTPSCRHLRLCSVCCSPRPCTCSARAASPSAIPLANDTTASSDHDDKIKQEIFGWIKELPVFSDDSEENKSRRRHMAEQLADELQELQKSGDFGTKAKDNILSCIENLPIWCPGGKLEQDIFRNQLASKLFEKLKGWNEQINVEEKISRWLEVIPFETDGDLSQIKNKMLKDIVIRLIPILDEPKEEIKKVVIMELENVMFKLVDKREAISDIADKLIDDIKPTENFSEQSVIEEKIWSWLETSNDLPDATKRTNKIIVKDFSKKLSSILIKNDNNEVIKKEIVDFIDKLSEKGTLIAYVDKNDFVEILLKDIRSMTRPRKRWDDRNNIPNNIADSDESIERNIDNYKVNVRKEENFSSVTPEVTKEFSKSNSEFEIDADIILVDAMVSATEDSSLEPAIHNKVKLVSENIPSQQSSKQTEIDLKLSIKEEVDTILDDFNIGTEYRHDIESSIVNILLDQIVRRTGTDQAGDEISRVLKDKHIAEDDVYNIVNKLMEKNKSMSFSFRGRDSRLNIQKDGNKNEMISSTFQSDGKDLIKDTLEREILNLSADITGDNSPKTRKKLKQSARKLANKLGPIITDSGVTNIEECILNEVTEYIKTLSLYTNESRDELGRKLTNRLLASTPHRDEYSFFPRDRTEISNVDLDSESNVKRSKIHIDEENYSKELTNVIRLWLDEINLNLNGSKDSMIKDLAADIIDRQTYLQLNPNATPTLQEELACFNYLIFKWLNKLVDIHKLSPIMSKTTNLMNKIKNITVPQIMNTPNYFDHLKSKSQEFPNNTIEIENAIVVWMEQIPSHAFLISDKRTICKKIHDLAEIIYELRLNNNIAEINAEIFNWMRTITQDKDVHYQKKITDELESILRENDLTKPISTKCPKDLLTRIIMNWLKQHPFHQTRCCHEKRIQESIVKQLVLELLPILENASIHGDNVDTIVIEKVISAFKQFPMDPEYQHNSNFIHDTAVNLLSHLTGFKIFEVGPQPKNGRHSSRRNLNTITIDASATLHSTARRISTGSVQAGTIRKEIETWCRNLPIDILEEQHANNLKQQIASKLIKNMEELKMYPDVINDDLVYENMLEDVINNVLSELGITNNNHKLAALKYDLFSKIRTVRTREENGENIFKENLHNVIPLSPPIRGLSPDKQANFEILRDSVAEAFINLHYGDKCKKEREKYKLEIQDEITKFCNHYLEKYPDTPIDSGKLNKELFKTLRKVSKLKENILGNDVEVTEIKDKIMNWLSELPLKRHSGTDQLEINKMVLLLAKKLNDIKKGKELFPETNHDNKMLEEVTNWLKNLPILNKNTEINEFAEKLMNNVKKIHRPNNMTMSSRFGPDTLDTIVEMPERPIYSSTQSREEHTVKGSTKNSRSPTISKDTSITSLPVNVSSQTKESSHHPQPPSSPVIDPELPSTVQTTGHRGALMPSVSSQVNVSPQVIVKEYYWDSPDMTLLENRSFCTPSQRMTMCPGLRHRPATQEMQSHTQDNLSELSSNTPCKFPSCRRPVPPDVLNHDTLQNRNHHPFQPYWTSPHSTFESDLSNRNYNVTPNSNTQSAGTPPRTLLPGQSIISTQKPTSEQGTSTQHTSLASKPVPRSPLPCVRTPCPLHNKGPCAPRVLRRRPQLPCISLENEAGPSISCRKPRATRIGHFNKLGQMFPKKAARVGLPEDEIYIKGDSYNITSKVESEKERLRCRCKENIFNQGSASKRRDFQPSTNDDSMQQCSKCCGFHCSYPSFRFFK